MQTLATSPAGSADGDQSASASSANATFDLAQIPSYTGSPYTVVNDNVPTFTEADLAGPEESYSPLDSLGRCGAAQPVAEASDESGNTAEDAAPSVDANAPASPEPAGSGSAQMTYILNTNTDVFHLPGCGSVNRMSEHNKQEFTGTRKEVTAAGFRPCGNCNP